VVPPANLKAYTSGNLILLRWEFNTFSRQDSNAPQITTIYRSEDGQNFKRLITIPAVIGLFSDSTITPGKNYYYRVSFSRVVQSSVPGAPGYEVESSFANLAQPVMIPVATPPAPQVVLTAQPTSYGAVALSWNPYPGAIDYTVYRKIGNGTFSIIGPVSLDGKIESTKSTALIDSTAQVGVSSGYYIVARTIAGLAPSSDVVSVTPTITPGQGTSNLTSNAITEFKVREVTPTTVSLGISATEKYSVYRSTDDSFYYLVATGLPGSGVITDINLKAGTKYWYRTIVNKGNQTVSLTTAPVITTETLSDITQSGVITFDVLSGEQYINRGQSLRLRYAYKNNSNQSQCGVKLTRIFVSSDGKTFLSSETVDVSGTNSAGTKVTGTVPAGATVPFTFDQYLNPSYQPGTFKVGVLVSGQWCGTGTNEVPTHVPGSKFSTDKQLPIIVQ
jgi:hypothetical protein